MSLPTRPCPATSVRSLLLTVLAIGLAHLLPAADVPIVFVSRELPNDPDPAVAAEDSPGVDEALESDSVTRRANSGRLLVLEEDGSLRTIIDADASPDDPSVPIDVMDPDVSWDGEHIVFTGYSTRERGWRIFEVKADGTGLHQLTRSDRSIDLTSFGEHAAKLEKYDDLDPCYLPDGRICLVSSRYPGIAPDGRARATNLYVMNADGSDLHRITTERFGADTPTVDPSTGEIVYSRWWRTAQDEISSENPPIPPGSPGYGGNPDSTGGIPAADPNAIRSIDEESFPGVNSWFLSRIRPDGTDMRMLSGVRLDRELTQAYRPSMLRSGKVLSLFIPDTPIIGDPQLRGIRLFSDGPEAPFEVAGPQTFSGLGPRVPLPADFPPELMVLLDGILVQRAPVTHAFASAVELPDGRILVSAAHRAVSDADLPFPPDADGPANDPLVDPDGDIPTPSMNFDLFLLQLPRPDRFDGSVRLQRIFGLEDRQELDATALVARQRAPVLVDRSDRRLTDVVPQTVEEAFEIGGSFEFVVENIHHQPPVDVETVGSPPVGKSLAIEFYMAPQGPPTAEGEKARLIERVEIPPSGRVSVELPAGVPLFEMLRRPDGGIAQGRDHQIYHVGGMNFGRAGETNRCVGCHAGHTLLELPDDEELVWTNLAPSATVGAVGTSGGATPFVHPPEDPDAPLDENGRLEDATAGNFQPHVLVDRSTRAFFSEWVAARGVDSEVSLRWSVPVEAREVVLHAPRAHLEGVFAEREMQIRRFHVTLKRADSDVESLEIAKTLELGETVRFALDPSRAFDRMTIAMAADDVAGSFDGHGGAALSEIEVIGRAAEIEARPQVLLRRGDATCDGTVNLTDAVAILSRLFSAGERLCCELAADTDANDAVNIADAIGLLDFLFRGGRPPAAPGPESCGRATETELICDNEVACS